MDLKELQAKSIEELELLLIEWREKLRDLRFKDSNKQLKNIRSIRETKKNIAQALTLIKEKKNLKINDN